MSLLIMLSGLSLCYAMQSKGMMLHSPDSPSREGKENSLVITYSNDTWESNYPSRTWAWLPQMKWLMGSKPG